MAKNRPHKKPQPSQTLVIDSSHSIPSKPIHEPLSLSFLHFRPGDHHCLSRCAQIQVKEAMDCLRQLTTMSWREVQNSGGRPGNKAGLGYTLYSHLKFPEVSPDTRIAGVRASGRFRIFGFHERHVFYILRFDPNHEEVPC